jgi:Zn finger protein HypA/HybF involved in hydrogenase expression
MDLYCDDCQETVSPDAALLERGYAYCPECGSALGKDGAAETAAKILREKL